MDIIYLKSLYITAQYNSISIAAKHLHLSQPGLSFQLQSLESSIGKTLLDRSNKGVVLTPAGEIVFKYAKSIIALEESMHQELNSLEKLDNQLTIGACPTLADYILPCSAFTFNQIHDNIHIDILNMNSYEVLKKIKDAEINIGIVQCLKNIPDMIQVPLTESNVVLVCNYNIPTSTITMDDLMKLPLITREPEAIINESIKQHLKNHNKEFNDLNVLSTLNSDEAIKRTLMYKQVYAFLPEIVIKHELQDKHLKKISVKDLSMKSSYALLYRKDYILKDYENSFVDFITSNHRCFCC